jgi:hypothetical protein
MDAVACDFAELQPLGIYVGIWWQDATIAIARQHENVHIVADLRCGRDPRARPQARGARSAA